VPGQEAPGEGQRCRAGGGARWGGEAPGGRAGGAVGGGTGGGGGGSGVGGSGGGGVRCGGGARWGGEAPGRRAVRCSVLCARVRARGAGRWGHMKEYVEYQNWRHSAKYIYAE